MTAPAPAPVAVATRTDVRTGTEVVESRHHGSLAVVGPDGLLAASLGDPARSTFVRSAAKPVQAAASLEILAAAGAAVPPLPEVAVGWASHRAEPRHDEAVLALLARSGTEPGQLTCPPACPDDREVAAASPLYHNCSGKHALFAAAGRALGVPRDRLLDPDGPLQRRVLARLGDVFGAPDAIAVDGCGAPAVAVPLERLAHGYRRLLLEGRFARVREAGFAHPLLVGGDGRLESALLADGVLAKPGAEGVFAAAWADGEGAWGAALKVEDGAARGAAAALHGLLTASGVVDAGRWSPPPVLGGGRPQGRIRPAAPVLDLAARIATR